MSTSFDAIVIGTGQSGVPLARKLAKARQKVAVIESGRFGGTCVNTGCIPTKAMVASARAAYIAGRGAEFGVDIQGSLQVDKVAENLLGKDKRRVSDRITAYAGYIDPPLGRAAMPETTLRESGRPVLIGKREMSRVGRAVEKGETQGFMKVMVDSNTQNISGAAILGTGGDEAIHCILHTMHARLPYTTLQRAVHIHPTLSELIPTMLGDLKPLC
jgi:pyruvate/2-oxoglutarate dehydrogenase complex dihydrolipoamide dehydrogenase (E3) component